jgi:DNA polymerase-4
MDAFFASVEEVLNPGLKGKPVIVGGRNGRGVVTSASYEARKYGIHSAMPGFQAKKLCPGGVFLPNRRRVYGDFSDKVLAILERYSPEVHAVSIDEWLVDLTGTENLFGPTVKTAKEILDRIEKELGLSASGGLSTSRVAAKIAVTSVKPRGFLYLPAGAEEAFLSPLPVGAVPGIGPKAQRELLQQGIKTIADLLKRPQLRRRYLDLDEPEREGHVHDHSIGNETTLERPLTKREKMEEVLWELVEEVGSRLRKQGLYARCITLKIRYSNFRTITRSRTLQSPTCFDREIFEVVRELLGKNLAHGAPVRLLGISTSRLLSSGWQESMFEVEKRLRWQKLYQGIDRLRGKYGEEAVSVATPHTRTR